MPIAILNSEFFRVALSLGSVVTGTYSLAVAVAKRFTTYHVYVRRFLTGLTTGIALGALTYLVDKQLGFFYERLLSPWSPVTLPNYTYGAAVGVVFFLSVFASPLIKEGERDKVNHQFLAILSSLLGGVAGAIFYPVAAIFLVEHFHWFGSSLNTIALLVIVVLGFIVGLVSALVVGLPAAQGKLEVAGTRGCIVYAISIVLSIPTVIAFGQIMGWGTFLSYIGLSLGVGVLVGIVNAIVNNLPPSVLAVMGVGLVVLFGLARGFETLSGAFR